MRSATSTPRRLCPAFQPHHASQYSVPAQTAPGINRYRPASDILITLAVITTAFDDRNRQTVGNGSSGCLSKLSKTASPVPEYWLQSGLPIRNILPSHPIAIIRHGIMLYPIANIGETALPPPSISLIGVLLLCSESTALSRVNRADTRRVQATAAPSS